MRTIVEREKRGLNGLLMLLVGLGMFATLGYFGYQEFAQLGLGRGGGRGAPELPSPLVLAGLVGGLIVTVYFLRGLMSVSPNESVVLQLFGKYVGTVRRDGLRWVSPFYNRRRVSVRARSFESPRLKVNDKDGNPIEVAAIVVFSVVDTAQAVFSVEDYAKFVYTQTESALRNLASRHPYDAQDHEHSLRRHSAEMALELCDEIQSNCAIAGVNIIDSKISHLAYAPEIAHAMLQRQQAAAIIAARTRIVEGAVGMVQMALEKLASENIVQLDDERKAQMVSNLLVVLTSERAAQPVVNAGTIYA